MAIAFNWATHAEDTTSTTTSVTTTSSSNTINSGDLLIVFIAWGDTTSSSIDAGTIVPPGGWTALVTQAATGNSENMRAGAFYKIAGGSETGAYNFTVTTAQTYAWVLIDYSGTASTVDASTSTTSTAGGVSIVAPSVSPAGSTDWLICAWYAVDLAGSTPYTFPGGFNSRANNANGGVFAVTPAIGIADTVLVSSGATGTQTATYYTARNSYYTLSATFAPSGAAPSLLPPTFTQSPILQVVSKVLSY